MYIFDYLFQFLMKIEIKMAKVEKYCINYIKMAGNVININNHEDYDLLDDHENNDFSDDDSDDEIHVECTKNKNVDIDKNADTELFDKLLKTNKCKSIHINCKRLFKIYSLYKITPYTLDQVLEHCPVKCLTNGSFSKLLGLIVEQSCIFNETQHEKIKNICLTSPNSYHHTTKFLNKLCCDITKKIYESNRNRIHLRMKRIDTRPNLAHIDENNLYIVCYGLFKYNIVMQNVMQVIGCNQFININKKYISKILEYSSKRQCDQYIYIENRKKFMYYSVKHAVHENCNMPSQQDIIKSVLNNIGQYYDDIDDDDDDDIDIDINNININNKVKFTTEMFKNVCEYVCRVNFKNILHVGPEFTEECFNELCKNSNFDKLYTCINNMYQITLPNLLNLIKNHKYIENIPQFVDDKICECAAKYNFHMYHKSLKYEYTLNSLHIACKKRKPDYYLIHHFKERKIHRNDVEKVLSNIDSVKYIIDTQIKPDQKCLEIACNTGNKHVIDYLINEHKLKPNNQMLKDYVYATDKTLKMLYQ